MPILRHDDCMSLRSCFHDKIRLEVYLDSEGYASGSVFFDDGESFKYETEGASAVVDY